MNRTTRTVCARCLTGMGMLCLVLAGLFTLGAMAENMNLARLGYVVAVFIAFGIAGVFFDTGDDMRRQAKERAQTGPIVER